MNALNQSNLITIASCDMCDHRKLSILIDKKIDIAVSTAWNGIRGRDWSNQELQKMMAITQSKSKLNYGAVPYPVTRIINVNPDVYKLKKYRMES